MDGYAGQPDKPIYEPTAEEIASSQMTAFVARCARAVGKPFPHVEAFHRFSVEEPSRFWSLLLDELDLEVSGDRTPVLVGESCETAQFFPQLKLSFTRNMLRAHAPGDEDRVAIVACDETGRRIAITRRELTARVLAVASSLSHRGIGPGDRVVAIAPNGVESVVACLASIAVGAAWSSVAPNLGLDAVLDRFGQLAPRVLFACSSYTYQGVTHPILDRVAEITGQVGSIEHVVMLDDVVTAAEGPRRVALEALAREGRDGPYRSLADLPELPFDHPAYVLFSSGTTGKPKCIVHGAGGTLLEHAKEHRLHGDLRPGDTLFFQTAAGWMMWNWLVSALASRVTILLYEGSATFPTPDALWRIVANERVTVFGTSPGYVQYTRDAGIEPHTLDLAALRAIQSTGSVLEPELFVWIAEHVKRVPVQSISGGTDIIGCFLLGHPNLPVWPGELQTKSLGYDVDAFGTDGKPVPISRIGELVCKRPFPSRPVGLFGDDEGSRFHNAYFAQNEGVWTHGDLLELSPRGGARIHGRSDGVLNVRGIRIGPAEIYRALAAGVPEVQEAMAVEQSDPREIGGSRLVLLVVLEPSRRGQLTDAARDALWAKIRHELSERCSPAHVPAVILERVELPVTHSGKRSERAARDAVNRRTVENLGALRNPAALDGLADAPELATEAAPRVAVGPSHDVSVDDLCALYKEVLGADRVLPDDAFFNLGGYSLAAVTLLARVERKYGVRLPMSALLARASTPRRMAAALADEAERQQGHIVAIRPEGTNVPVFWLPGGGGLSVLAFREVSMRLGENQPVYGFEAKLTLDDAPSSIRQIAHRYVEDLVAAFPNGPYLLLGFSFGSWVAFEMGVELRKRGKQVPLLCVFDSPIPQRRSSTDRARIAAQRAGYHAKNVTRMPLAEMPQYVRGVASVAERRAREALTKLGWDVDVRSREEASGDTVFDTLDRKNRAAAAAYVRGAIPTFDGKITVVLAQRTSQSAVAPDLDDRLAIGKHATGGMDVYRVSGAHLTMLEPPEVDELASLLRTIIARAIGATS